MGIFRKASLERLSSPEELDQLMYVTSVRSWLLLIGMFLLLAMAVFWGIEGSIPTTVSGQGAIIRRGGVMNVVTRGAGVMVELNVKVGDRVSANQVVARVAQPATMEKLQNAREALDRARREREEFRKLHSQQAGLQIQAVQRQEDNAQHQIQELQQQATLASEQIRIEDDLLAKGLVTRQQTIAARQHLASIESDIANRRAEIKQLEAQRFEYQAKPLEMDTEMNGKVFELERDLAELQKEFEINSSVVSPYAGEVIELKVYPGATVASQTPVLSIQPETNNLEILAYVPSLRAKEIKTGMDVQISPSTVKREEYGYMLGRVIHVADFPSTKAALMRNFENENLISALTDSGTVTEVRVEMAPDSMTPSGFRWSSSKGPPILLSGGTLCSVQIVTMRQKPLALVMPFLKQKLGLD